MESDIALRDLGRASSREVLAILNDAILTSTALWDYAARPLSAMESWFAAKETGRFPVIGAVDRHDTLLGFATYGTFRGWPAYKYSVEHSVYVHRDHRRKGLGLLLLTAVIERAQQQEFHTLIAGIEASNEASRALHRRLGFEHCGTVRHAGYKFGRWLDLEFHQRILTTPALPVEG